MTKADLLASMRRVIVKGTPRNVAIVSAVKAHVTCQAIADELGLSRQRVQQIVSRSHD
jgi:predicted transcriptional regulator